MTAIRYSVASLIALDKGRRSYCLLQSLPDLRFYANSLVQT